MSRQLTGTIRGEKGPYTAIAFPIHQLGLPKDLEWKLENFERLNELRLGARAGANSRKEIAKMINDCGLKAVPALHQLPHFDIYEDILLV